MDLVVDTDGFFVLFSRHNDGTVQERLQLLSQSDRLTLLGTDPRNRWVPQNHVELIELTKSARARLRGAKRVLLVKLRDGTTLDIDLMTKEQVDIVTSEFRRMLGPFFQA